VLSQKLSSFARAGFAGVLAAILLAIALLVPASAEARGYPRQYAGIVVDAKSGKVLFETSADVPRFPASVSKVMTLYILFQELSAGHITLATKFTVSPWAASAEPTKLGLRAGSQIAVEDVIRAIVTLSANDMARVVAENIGGSEGKFAERMTATAHALGMAHTTYVNASGLPDSRQITTVRDQARLGMAIYEHFPKFYAYFQTRSFQYGRRVYGNHNHLLGVDGIDGIKTGYTGAAGYNLLTAARADDRHIIVVGFGFGNAGTRDATVRGLVRKYMPMARQGDYLQTAMIPVPGRQQRPTVMVASVDPTIGLEAAAPSVVSGSSVTPMPVPAFRADDQILPEPVAYAPEPQARPGVPAGSAPSAATGVPMDIGVKPAVAALSAIGEPSRSRQPSAVPDVVGQWVNDVLLGAPPAPLGSTRRSAPLVPPVGIGDKNEPIDLMTSGSVAGRQVAEATLAAQTAVPTSSGVAAPLVAAASPVVPGPDAAATDTAAPAPAGAWIVQIGAAPTSDGAKQLLGTASGKIASLVDLRPYVERFDKDGQTFYRARFIGFGGRDQATTMCDQLKRAKMSCLAMQS
jgi:D-alanyl-D-alanine carboxypeptidase